MIQEFTLWKHQLRCAIIGLGNIEVESSDSSGSGFREAMRALYQEGHFAYFLSLEGWRQAGLSHEVGKELEHLRQQLDEYDEPDSDAAIQADPHWWAIIAQANMVAALLA